METAAEKVVLSLEFAAKELVLQRQGNVGSDVRWVGTEGHGASACRSVEIGPSVIEAWAVGQETKGARKSLSFFWEGSAAGPLCDGLCTRAVGSASAGQACEESQVPVKPQDASKRDVGQSFESLAARNWDLLGLWLRHGRKTWVESADLKPTDFLQVFLLAKSDHETQRDESGKPCPVPAGRLFLAGTSGGILIKVRRALQCRFLNHW